MSKLVLNRKEASGSSNHCIEQILNVEGSELEIYDYIVPWKFDAEDPGVSVEDVSNILNEVPDEDLTVRINSRGGEVGTALTIYNRLRDHKSQVTTVVDGYAFSSAGWIAQAGDVRNIATGGIFMIHNPQMQPHIGSLEDLDKVRNQWEAHQKSILNIFEERTSVSPEEILNYMEKETFLSAEDAVEIGFFDGIHEGVANLQALNYAPPVALPDTFKNSIQPFDAPAMEDLRAQRNRLAQKERILFQSR
jgi:ATP-dependent protease ClpP protease subunit